MKNRLQAAHRKWPQILWVTTILFVILFHSFSLEHVREFALVPDEQEYALMAYNWATDGEPHIYLNHQTFPTRYPPAMPLLSSALFRLGVKDLAHNVWLPWICGLLLLGSVVLVIYRETRSPYSAYLSLIFLGLSPLHIHLSTRVMTETLSTLGIFWLIYGLTRLSKTHKVHWGWGVLAGALTLVRIPNGAWLILGGLYLLLNPGAGNPKIRLKNCVRFCLGALFGLCLLLLYQQWQYGDFLMSGYDHWGMSSADSWHFKYIFTHKTITGIHPNLPCYFHLLAGGTGLRHPLYWIYYGIWVPVGAALLWRNRDQISSHLKRMLTFAASAGVFWFLFYSFYRAHNARVFFSLLPWICIASALGWHLILKSHRILFASLVVFASSLICIPGRLHANLYLTNHREVRAQILNKHLPDHSWFLSSMDPGYAGHFVQKNTRRMYILGFSEEYSQLFDLIPDRYQSPFPLRVNDILGLAAALRRGEKIYFDYSITDNRQTKFWRARLFAYFAVEPVVVDPKTGLLLVRLKYFWNDAPD